MMKIKETIAALTAGDLPGAAYISRKEQEPISDERFSLIVKSATRICISVAGAVVAVNIDAWKLLILAGAGLFALICIEFKD